MKKAGLAIARRAGDILIAIAIIHVISGFFFYGESLNGIIKAGLFDTVEQRPEWFGFFWFEIGGFFLLMFGLLARNYIARCRRCLPRNQGLILLLLSGVSLVLSPYSGFYLFLPVAIAIIANADHDTVPARTI